MNAMHDDQSENPKAPGRRQHADDDAASPGLTHNKSEGLTPGEILREGRLAHDYSIDDLCAQTKLNRRTIEALEENDFQALSQPVFARGYYRQCAKVLDLDTDRLMAAYAAIAGEEPRPRVDYRSAGAGAISQDVTPSGGFRFRRLLILLLFVVILGLAIISVLPSHGIPSVLTGSTGTGSGSAETGDQVTQSGQGGQGGQSQGGQSDQDTKTFDFNSSSNESSSGASGPNAVSSVTAKKPGTGQTPGTPDVVGKKASQSQTGQPQTGQPQTGQKPGGRNVSKTLGMNPSGPSSAPASTGNSNNNTASAAGQPSVPPNRLVLKFSRRSWVRVTDANGNRMAARTFAAGDTKEFNGKPPYKVTLGFAPGVKMTIGGKPVNVAGHTSGSGVAHLTVDAPNNGNG